jgi:hypothetical protein
VLLVQSKLIAAAALVALALGSAVSFAGVKTVNGVEVRDWQAIDVNKDGSISPEEMEKFLQDTWATNKNK